MRGNRIETTLKAVILVAILVIFALHLAGDWWSVRPIESIGASEDGLGFWTYATEQSSGWSMLFGQDWAVHGLTLALAGLTVWFGFRRDRLAGATAWLAGLGWLPLLFKPGQTNGVAHIHWPFEAYMVAVTAYWVALVGLSVLVVLRRFADRF